VICEYYYPYIIFLITAENYHCSSRPGGPACPCAPHEQLPICAQGKGYFVGHLQVDHHHQHCTHRSTYPIRSKYLRVTHLNSSHLCLLLSITLSIISLRKKGSFSLSHIHLRLFDKPQILLCYLTLFPLKDNISFLPSLAPALLSIVHLQLIPLFISSTSISRIITTTSEFSPFDSFFKKHFTTLHDSPVSWETSNFLPLLFPSLLIYVLLLIWL